MSNLSDLLPAGGGQNAEKFVASGTLASGQTVALKTDGTVTAVGGETQAVGSPVVFESANTPETGSAYDANAQKVVIAYRDVGNSGYGTAVVGTVSGTSISFGSPVVFESAVTRYSAVTYDANAQKIVIAYRDSGNSNLSTAIVGTVSGTSISFGTAVVFDSSSGASNKFAATYDVNAQKVVIAYMDSGDNGFAIVGTVSGTSISFGSRATIESSRNDDLAIVYDSSAQKIVIAYKDIQNSSYGTGAVGTVSGTSISFGTPSVFNTGTTNQNSIAYDANAQKVVVVFQDHESSNHGAAIVGTVSGTSISFGSKVTFNAAATTHPEVAYDANAKKVVISYNDNNSLGEVIEGTVSGTSISFGSAVQFEPAAPQHITTVYDSTAQKVVTSYQDSGNSGYGTSFVFQASSSNSTDFLGITAEGISNGATGSVNLLGGINEAQSGLTIGSDYYVQNDGSISSPTGAYPYSISGGVYDSVSLTVSDNLTSIFFKPDGTKMYAIGYTNDTVYEYGLSSSFDLSTATLNGNTKNISAQSGYFPSIVFKSDGTKMYALGGGSVFQYSLSTAWDVSSAAYDSKSLSVSSQDSNSSGIWFKSDGSQMYMCGFTNDSIFQYNLSTPWDVSTGSYASISFDMSATSTQPRNMYFNSAGNILFLADTANPDKVFKFVLSTAWDITTISLSSSLDVSAQAAKAVDVVLNADGTKMYVADSENTNTIYQYTLMGSSSSVLAGQAISATTINMRNLT